MPPRSQYNKDGSLRAPRAPRTRCAKKWTTKTTIGKNGGHVTRNVVRCRKYKSGKRILEGSKASKKFKMGVGYV